MTMLSVHHIHHVPKCISCCCIYLVYIPDQVLVLVKVSLISILANLFFFYLCFLSQPFTNHGTAGEGGGHFFNSSLPLPPASQTFRH